jgi:hypothetical protein
MAEGPALRRPISDWVARQGSQSAEDWEDILHTEFVANYVVWYGYTGPRDEVYSRVMAVDYAGLDADGMSAPDIGGNVLERPVSDGTTTRTEVHVTAHTKGALAYVLEYFPSDPDSVFGATLFGATPAEVADGVEASLGDSVLDVVYVVNRRLGDPMEDLVAVLFCSAADHPEVICPGGEPPTLISLSFHATASGELRAAFGVTEGTPGAASTQQTGRFNASSQGALADGFPAERVRLHATAQ